MRTHTYHTRRKHGKPRLSMAWVNINLILLFIMILLRRANMFSTRVLVCHDTRNISTSRRRKKKVKKKKDLEQNKIS